MKLDNLKVTKIYKTKTKEEIKAKCECNGKTFFYPYEIPNYLWGENDLIEAHIKAKMKDKRIGYSVLDKSDYKGPVNFKEAKFIKRFYGKDWRDRFVMDTPQAAWNEYVKEEKEALESELETLDYDIEYAEENIKREKEQIAKFKKQQREYKARMLKLKLVRNRK